MLVKSRPQYSGLHPEPLARHHLVVAEGKGALAVEDLFACAPYGRANIVADGRAFAWDISPGALEATACKVAGRTLTEAEWALYLPDRPYAPACAGGS